jgi:hypothetical protein
VVEETALVYRNVPVHMRKRQVVITGETKESMWLAVAFQGTSSKVVIDYQGKVTLQWKNCGHHSSLAIMVSVPSDKTQGPPEPTGTVCTEGLSFAISHRLSLLALRMGTLPQATVGQMSWVPGLARSWHHGMSADLSVLQTVHVVIAKDQMSQLRHQLFMGSVLDAGRL